MNPVIYDSPGDNSGRNSSASAPKHLSTYPIFYLHFLRGESVCFKKGYTIFKQDNVTGKLVTQQTTRIKEK